MNADLKIEISPDVLFQEINGETVLLDLKSESYFGLDTTATRIWQLLKDQRNLDEIFDIMADEFDVDPAVLRKDLQVHVQELESAGLITLIRQD